MAGRTNLAGPAGRWSASHWKTATFGWLAFAVVAVVVGSAVGTRNLTDAETASGQAAKAQRILVSVGFNAPATESLLVQSRTATHDKPEFNAVVGQFVLTVSGQANVTNIVAPFEHPNAPGQVSKGGHSVRVQFDVKGKAADAKDKVKRIVDFGLPKMRSSINAAPSSRRPRSKKGHEPFLSTTSLAGGPDALSRLAGV